MTIYALLIVTSMATTVSTVRAQIEINLETDLLSRSDTLWVDVRLLSETDSLQHPINSFQFKVVTPVDVAFLGSDSRYTLSGEMGWSTGQNIENGRVGGFSSSLDAIARKGVLIRLQFLLKGTDTIGTIELSEFRLNSGIPDHLPVTPSLRLDRIDHLE
ncbi:MAG: hypothetical protein BMS9Abin05_1746 [Rhodothermia bacterium]|nr:MAG: hypothetical protein BMS9Abin05_1746 [Rhodothermia bacterium]